MRKELNIATVKGRFGKDPVLKYTNSGTAYLDFSIANRQDYKKDGETVEITHWVECRAWGKNAETISKFFTKGSSIIVIGPIVTQKWETSEGDKKSRTYVDVSNFYFGGDSNGSSSDSATQSRQQTQSQKQGVAQTYTDIESYVAYEDETLPF